MKTRLILLLVTCLGWPTARAADTEIGAVIKDSLAFAATQYSGLVEAVKTREGFPRHYEKGELLMEPSRSWTSGFFPGSCWYLFEATQDPRWKETALKYTALVEPEKHNREIHDVGFMLGCSFGNGYRLTRDPAYRDVLLTGAESLISRYNPTVGCLKSWDTNANWGPIAVDWKFPVIVDNLMNLELLLWATKESGDPRFRDIALSHADKTLKNHFRSDGSSYHVLNYDPATGEILHRQTWQGLSPDSAWARGQSWGLYGCTLLYRETRHAAYLEQAKKIAAFLIHHPRLPADKIPHWDYDAKDLSAAPRDASAAAIMASALLELSDYVEPALQQEYLATAEAQIRSLSSPAYRAELGKNGHFLLMHCVGSLPHAWEIDVPISYADYYYLEALLRLQARLKPAAKS